MDYPKVSVVIAVGRTELLYEESLKRQDYPNYEVIPVRGHMAGAARNIGIKKAKGDIIALIDDDVVLPDRWMSNGVHALTKSKGDIVGGPNIILLGSPITERISDFLLSIGMLNGFRKKFKKSEWAGFSNYTDFATCNIMMRRDVFKKAGFFDEKYKIVEDMEFLLRCQMRGLSFYYTSDFFLYHKRRNFPVGIMKQLFSWGYGNMHMAVNYPFIFKRVDIWGSLIFFPALTVLFRLNFKFTMITAAALFPVTLYLSSYALGAVTGLVVFLWYRKVFPLVFFENKARGGQEKHFPNR